MDKITPFLWFQRQLMIFGSELRRRQGGCWGHRALFMGNENEGPALLRNRAGYFYSGPSHARTITIRPALLWIAAAQSARSFSNVGYNAARIWFSRFESEVS